MLLGVSSEKACLWACLDLMFTGALSMYPPQTSVLISLWLTRDLCAGTYLTCVACGRRSRGAGMMLAHRVRG